MALEAPMVIGFTSARGTLAFGALGIRKADRSRLFSAPNPAAAAAVVPSA
jgi:hypothetical protein